MSWTREAKNVPQYLRTLSWVVPLPNPLFNSSYVVMVRVRVPVVLKRTVVGD